MAVPQSIKKVIPVPLRNFLKRVRAGFWGLFVLGDYQRFKKLSQSADRGFRMSYGEIYPCLSDKTAGTSFERHYVYHTAWAERCVKKIAPAKHVDIGSIIYFSATLSAFIPTDFYDYRPADIMLSNLGSYEGDLTHLPFKDSQLDSVSCLHTLEHVGLGRYGDPIDPNGDLTAMRELSRVVASGGNLLIVVPTGKLMKIQFNANRTYTYDAIVSYFPDFALKTFAYIPEEAKRGNLIDDASPSIIGDEEDGCGCYWFVKKKS